MFVLYFFNKVKILIFFLFLFFTTAIQLPIKAQQVNTFYFMKDIPVRHYLNPSFQPSEDLSISLPIIGFTQYYLGDNSFSVKDLLYNRDTKNTSLFRSQASIDGFYNTLRESTIIRTDLQTNLISLGFRDKDNYWTFSLSEKINGWACLPRDAFRIALYGTTDQANSYDLSSLQTDISIYTEAAFGFSRAIDKKWTLGAKVKLLYGSANISNTDNQIDLKKNNGVWSLIAKGIVNVSSPVQVSNIDSSNPISYITPTRTIDWLKPSGVGAGLDIGGEYKLNRNIKLSGAITDVGFINWFKNVQSVQYKANYTFMGIQKIDSSSSINTFPQIFSTLGRSSRVDSLKKVFEPSANSITAVNTYLTVTNTKLNFGAEYSLDNEKVSFGVLSRTYLYRSLVSEDITASVNTQPKEWLSASFSYSLFSGRATSLGVGVGLKAGIMHWFFAADYLPVQTFDLALSDIGFNNSIGTVPTAYNSSDFNLAIGFNFVFSEIYSLGLHRKKKMQECRFKF